MRAVGKMERMEGDDFYDDDWNIDNMEEKVEIAEELKGLIEDLKNGQLDGNQVSKYLIQYFIMRGQLLTFCAFIQIKIFQVVVDETAALLSQQDILNEGEQYSKSVKLE